MHQLSLSILDIAQNSLTANASLVEIAIVEKTFPHTLEITISDNGNGMTDEQLKNATDPFYTTKKSKKVGLGISLYKMSAELTGGKFSIYSKINTGTSVSALFHTDHIDCPPLGNISDTVFSLITSTDADIYFRHEKDDTFFEIDTRQFREILGDIPISSPQVVLFIREYLNRNKI